VSKSSGAIYRQRGNFSFGQSQIPRHRPIRFTMDVKDGVKAIIPIRYGGWKHFREGRDRIEKEFLTAGLSSKLQWLKIGKPTDIEV